MKFYLLCLLLAASFSLAASLGLADHDKHFAGGDDDTIDGAGIDASRFGKGYSQTPTKKKQAKTTAELIKLVTKNDDATTAAKPIKLVTVTKADDATTAKPIGALVNQGIAGSKVGASGDDDGYIGSSQPGYITCNGDKMTIKIGLDDLHGDPMDYHLLDLKCKGTIVSNEMVFNFDYDKCGTLREANETHVIDSNSLLNFDISNLKMPGSIIYHKEHRVTYHCSYPRLPKAIPVAFKAKLLDYNYLVNGIANNGITSDLFTDSELTKPVDSSRRMRLNTTIFVKISRPDAGNTTFITPSQCNGYPTNSPEAIQPMIEKSACFTLDEFKYVRHDRDNYVFKFPAFGFLAKAEQVSLACTINICRVGDDKDESCNIPTKTCEYDPDIPDIKSRRADGQTHSIFKVDNNNNENTSEEHEEVEED